MKLRYVPAIAALVLAGSTALAIPAMPRTFIATQPDGTRLTLTAAGDEYFHCFLTESGRPVRRGADGTYRYLDADGRLTDEVARPSDALTGTEPTYASTRDRVLSTSARYGYMRKLRAAMPGAIPALAAPAFDNADGHDMRAVPTKGDCKVLVILVEFADKAFVYPDPHKGFTDMLNAPGYSANGATGSARDYYLKSSLGQYRPDFEVLGPVKLPYGMAHYGANGPDGNDINPAQMVADACAALDSQINFKDYDTSGDGYVDNVYLFYPGQGEATGGPDDSVWPHSWELEEAGINLSLDGVKISRYAASDEVSGDGSFIGIGTFCHEFAHVLGLPDFYDVLYGRDTITPCSYSLEAHGSYNNKSRTPPVFSSYERYGMEWIKPIELPSDADITLLPALESGVAYKIPTNVPTEYFILENRQQAGWDEYLPGSGLLIWHIDYNRDIWQKNLVNIDPERERVAILRANPVSGTSSQSEFPFPGDSEVFSLGTEPAGPAIKSYGGYDTGTVLSDICLQPDGSISFRVKSRGAGSAEVLPTPDVKVVEVAPRSFTIEWTPDPKVKDYYATVLEADRYEGNNYREAVASSIGAVSIGTSGRHTFTSLSPDRAYIVQLRAGNPDGSVSEAGSAAVQVPATVGRPLLAVSKAGDGTASLVWSGADAETMDITIAESYTDRVESTELVDFTDNRAKGWSLGGMRFDSQLFGQAAPSLSLRNLGAYVESPVYDSPVLSFSFWGAAPDGGATQLDIIGVDSEDLPVYYTVLTDFTATGSKHEVVMPDNVYGIRMAYRHAGARLNLDDIEVRTGSREYLPLADFAPKRVTGSSLKLELPDKDREYYAFLQPAGTDTPRLRSNTLKVSTGDTSIEAVNATDNSALRVRVSGGVLSVEGADAPYSVFTADGRMVAHGVRGSLSLPSRGLYIVRCGNASAKTVW